MYYKNTKHLGRAPINDDDRVFNEPLPDPPPINTSELFSYTEKAYEPQPQPPSIFNERRTFGSRRNRFTRRPTRPTTTIMPENRIIGSGELQTITNIDIIEQSENEKLPPVLRQSFAIEAERRGLKKKRSFTAPIVEVDAVIKDIEPLPSDTGDYVQQNLLTDSPPTFIEAAAATDNNILKYGILGVGFYILYDSFIKKGAK